MFKVLLCEAVITAIHSIPDFFSMSCSICKFIAFSGKCPVLPVQVRVESYEMLLKYHVTVYKKI